MNLQKSDLGYEVLDNGGRLLGEVWKVAGRSFSGAWHWSAVGGSTGARCMTRKEAVDKVEDEKLLSDLRMILDYPRVDEAKP